MIRALLAKMQCYFAGHKRGKRTGIYGANALAGHVDYQCARCKARWTRKVKVKA